MQGAIMKHLKYLRSSVVFIFFAILFAFLSYGLVPYLESVRIPPFYAYSIAMNIGFLIMLIISLVITYKEIKSLKIKKILNFLNFKKIEKKNIKLLIIVFLIEMGLFLLALPLNEWFITNVFSIPDNTPIFADPRVDNVLEIIDQNIGLSGNILLLFITLITLMLNVIGEEFFWRGIVLQRQSHHIKKNLWLIHGLMWAFFHSFKYYDLWIILPVSLGLSYAVVKTKNNTAGLIFHFLTNSTTFFVLAYYILFT
jgi:membrane protease YdiL (CAAX protease family)